MLQAALEASLADSLNKLVEASQSSSAPEEATRTEFYMAFDTNCYLECHAEVQRWVDQLPAPGDEARSSNANSSNAKSPPPRQRVLLPAQVVQELDYKKGAPDKNLQFRSRNASRSLMSMVESGKVRVQREGERDITLRYDDAILDCCLKFAGLLGATGTPSHKKGGAGGERHVALCSNDRDLRLRARAEGLRVLCLNDLRSFKWW
jgi:rRNA-processing protein FCF1